MNNKSNYKKIILAVIVLAVIIAFVFFKFFRNNNSTADLSYAFDPERPIVIYNNGKYGYITSEGKMMIEPKYNYASNFYGDYAVVKADNHNSESYYKEIYQIIDKKGNVKLSLESYVAPEYHRVYNVWEIDEVLYDSKLNRITSEEIKVDYIDYGYFSYRDYEKNESGIMTYNGKKVFEMPGTSISAQICENKYTDDDLYANVNTYVDSEKNLVVSLKTGDILFTLDDADDYYIFEEENGIFRYYNHTEEQRNIKYLFFIDNKLAYQTTETVEDVEVYNYEDQILEIDYGYNYENLGKTQRTYYYDVKNKKMLEKAPSISTPNLDSTEQTYGFKEYSCSGDYGLMDGEKILVPCEYDDIDYLPESLYNYMKSEGKELVLLEKDEKIILYDLKKGESVTTFDSYYVDSYSSSTFIQVPLYDEDGYTRKGYTIYNLLSDKSMNFDKNDEIYINSNYIELEKDGKTIYYNTNFKEIYVADEN